MPTFKAAFESSVARTLLSLPAPLARALAGPPETVGARTLDPHIQLLLRADTKSGAESISSGGPGRSRPRYRKVASVAESAPPVIAGWRDDVLQLEGRDVPVRIYHPEGFVRPLPLIVYFHGGGFVIGDLNTHDTVCRRLALGSGSAVVSVAYRLAPEHPHPAAIDDSRDALDALRNDAKRWCIDPHRIAVAGDSAGGNIAAVISPGAGLKGQLLYYPATDAVTPTESKARFAEGYGLGKADIGSFFGDYAPGVDPADPRVSPIFADNLHESPPTRMVIAGFDPLRDEGRAMAAALEACSVPVDLVEHAGWIHGYIHMGAHAAIARSLHEDGLRLGDLLRA